jgi:phenylacetate-CoA ligase
VIYYYLLFKLNERRSFAALEERQRKQLLREIAYCLKHVSYYKSNLPFRFRDLSHFNVRSVLGVYLGVSKKDIRGDHDLALGRGVFRWTLKSGRTGGSTGAPLQYKISQRCSWASFALLYRGWGYAGYVPGDKMAVLAGGSLVGKNQGWKTKLVSNLLGIRKFSSYGINDADRRRYCTEMRCWGAEFLRGYVSSIVDFADYAIR